MNNNKEHPTFSEGLLLIMVANIKIVNEIMMKNNNKFNKVGNMRGLCYN